MRCKFRWVNRRAKKIECTQCGHRTKTEQTDLSRVHRPCRPEFAELPECVNLGEVMRIIDCGCGGRSKAEIRECAIYGECTTFATNARNTPQAICLSCPHYQEKE